MYRLELAGSAFLPKFRYVTISNDFLESASVSKNEVNQIQQQGIGRSFLERHFIWEFKKECNEKKK